MSKTQLEQRVLADPRVQIYDCGRRDIQAGQIDRRVLATLEFLAGSGLKPYVSTLKCGHSYLSSAGTVSEHTSGDAVDIAKINGIPIIGHQGRGLDHRHHHPPPADASGHHAAPPDHLADDLPRPSQHAWRWATTPTTSTSASTPLFGDNAKLAQQYNTVLKPSQWVKLIDRLNQIDNPVVPTKPSKYAIKRPAARPLRRSGPDTASRSSASSSSSSRAAGPGRRPLRRARGRGRRGLPRAGARDAGRAGATPARRRRAAKATEPEPEPAPVTTGRATVIDGRAVRPTAGGAAWLREAREPPSEVDRRDRGAEPARCTPPLAADRGPARGAGRPPRRWSRASVGARRAGRRGPLGRRPVSWRVRRRRRRRRGAAAPGAPGRAARRPRPPAGRRGAGAARAPRPRPRPRPRGGAAAARRARGGARRARPGSRTAGAGRTPRRAARAARTRWGAAANAGCSPGPARRRRAPRRWRTRSAGSRPRLRRGRPGPRRPRGLAPAAARAARAASSASSSATTSPSSLTSAPRRTASGPG